MQRESPGEGQRRCIQSPARASIARTGHTPHPPCPHSPQPTSCPPDPHISAPAASSISSLVPINIIPHLLRLDQQDGIALLKHLPAQCLQLPFSRHMSLSHIHLFYLCSCQTALARSLPANQSLRRDTLSAWRSAMLLSHPSFWSATCI